MVLNHLMSLGSLMHIPDVIRDSVNTPTEGPNSFLKFLCATISQSDVIVNIGFVSHKGFVFECFLE